MSLDFLKKKEHMFKLRKFSDVKVVHHKMRYYSGVFTARRIRYELVYLRVFYKLFKRRTHKGLLLFRRFKVFFFLRVCFLLTMKSRNSRMGAGVGHFIRLAAILKAGKPFLLTRHVPKQVLAGWVVFFNSRWRLFFFWKYKQTRLPLI